MTSRKMFPRRRKTIQVEWIRTEVNNMLAISTCSPAERDAMASVLTAILHHTDNYRGFNYTEWVQGGHDQWKADGKPNDNTPYLGDQSRKVYY